MVNPVEIDDCLKKKYLFNQGFQRHDTVNLHLVVVAKTKNAYRNRREMTIKKRVKTTIDEPKGTSLWCAAVTGN